MTNLPIKNKKLLANPEFCKLWGGQMLAHLADAIVQIALIAWIITFLEIAGKEIATVFFFFLTPQFLLSPFTGAIADKFDRKMIMIITSVYRALLIGVAAMCVNYLPDNLESGKILIVIYILAFGLGLGYTFFYAAKMACMTNVVIPAQLKLANTINSGSINFINIFGAALAGIGVLKIGLFPLLMLTSLMYVCAAVMFFSINIIYPQKFADKFNSVLGDVKQAVNYILKHKAVLQIILLSVSISLIFGTFTNALNTLTVDYYHLGINGITQFRIMIGVGILVGMALTFVLSKIKKISAIFSFGFFVLFLTLFTCHLCKTISMAWFWLLPIGIAVVLIMVTIDTGLQKFVPDRIRGKVFGFQLTMNTLAFICGTVVIMTSDLEPLNMIRLLGAISFIYTLLIVLKSFRIGHKN